MYVICIPATSPLFFFRIRAIFSRCRYVIWFFGFMWLGVVEASFTVPQAISATSTGSTNYCTTKTMKSFAVLSRWLTTHWSCWPLRSCWQWIHMLCRLWSRGLEWRCMAIVYLHSPEWCWGIIKYIISERHAHHLDILWHANSALHYSTVGSNLLTSMMFCINSFPNEYRNVHRAEHEADERHGLPGISRHKTW